MDCYTLMLVGDERSPVRRFQIPKKRIRQALWGVGVFALLLTVGTGDYWRVRADNRELGGLRVETVEQREQIRGFEQKLASMESELERVLAFERKVRIIANLPGAVAAGGDDVTELAPPIYGDADANHDQEPMLPAGVPIDPAQHGEALEIPQARIDAADPVLNGLSTSGAKHVFALGKSAESLTGGAALRAASLQDLVLELEDKRSSLASMPSVWPTRGWLTSRFGPRVSPFTGRRHQHTGIDIATKLGTPVIAPADGLVSFVGSKGPLGKTVIVDHGNGIKTFYGHANEIHVKKGQQVGRGDRLADVGNSGRSTGPHLHYSVQVRGKPKNPLNYIFD